MNTADIQLEHPRHLTKIIDYGSKCALLDEKVLAMISVSCGVELKTFLCSIAGYHAKPSPVIGLRKQGGMIFK